MVIATHDGIFHADDVFAVMMLLKVHGREHEIIRTRNPEALDHADIVVDTGGKSDPPRYFDHHQSDFNERRPTLYPYASAGLVALHYWRGLFPSWAVYARVDRKLILPIDLIDSGIQIYEPVDGVHPYTVSDIIHSLNGVENTTAWNDTQYIRFLKAINMAEEIFDRAVIRAARWVQDNEFVSSLAKKHDGKVLVLPKPMSWIEAIVSNNQTIEYVVYPDMTGIWMIQAVPASHQAVFGDLRNPLPSPWAGKRDKDLAELTGVAGAVFCHRGLWLAGAKTKEDALMLADMAISE